MAGLTRAEFHELYYYMRLTRSLEERLEYLFRQGRIAGGLYRSLGQEGESVGAAYALEDGDYLSPAIRNLGAMLVRGVTPLQMFCQYMGRSCAPSKGKDNTTHFHDHDIGFIGPVSPLGTMVCVMDGVALAFQRQGKDRVGLTFLGDGGSRTGAAHEGISFAAARGLPVIVVVENNGWAFGTRTSEETALEELAAMAEGYGVAGERVDGNDVLAVYEATRAAVRRARSGSGMTLIEVVTYRMKGHAQHDSQSYVPEEELAEWRAQDPIDRYVEWLVSDGHATAEDLSGIDDGIGAELDEAMEEALASPEPDPAESLAEVYAGAGAPAPWYRRL
jgi:pyruvate dehydrogenase E1 component alpha subunit/2-oxoisovalerate dehydrogenase E1 component alpha subunit